MSNHHPSDHLPSGLAQQYGASIVESSYRIIEGTRRHFPDMQTSRPELDVYGYHILPTVYEVPPYEHILPNDLTSHSFTVCVPDFELSHRALRLYVRGHNELRRIEEQADNEPPGWRIECTDGKFRAFSHASSVGKVEESPSRLAALRLRRITTAVCDAFDALHQTTKRPV